MRMYDLIKKKRDGERLTKEQIRFMIEEYASDRIPDYQMSAMLMAIYFQGMQDEELAELTDAMAHSGELEDLSPIEGVKVDKHSTGGVGDKTTLIVGPLVAACGVKVAKMSGRGLGHTGGTVDKLEAIPGLRTAFTPYEFFDIVNETGICLAGQSGNLAPADKKLYALRDVTATVDSLPLIAASIMSKKLASGSDGILLDVKVGSGAFMKEQEDARELAEKMVAIGNHAGKKMAALLTNMNQPLGLKIGNALEVEEAIDTLRGIGPRDLTEVCLNLAGNMLYLADKGTQETCMEMAYQALKSGEGLRKFQEMIAAQGGNSQVIFDAALLPRASHKCEVYAPRSGWIGKMDTEEIGRVSALLGAGRKRKEDGIDYGAGIVLMHKIGAYVEEGECLAALFASSEDLFADAIICFRNAISIEENKPEEEPLIFDRIG